MNTHPTPEHTPLPLVRALTAIGVCFVVLAIILIMVASWSGFSGLGRSLAVLVPFLTSYAAGYRLTSSKVKGQLYLGTALRLLGILATPFVVGTVLLSLFELDITSLTLTYTTALSATWYLFTTWAAKDRLAVPAIPVAVLATILSYAGLAELAGWITAAIIAGVGVLTILFGLLNTTDTTRQREVLISLGVAPFLVATFVLPFVSGAGSAENAVTSVALPTFLVVLFFALYLVLAAIFEKTLVQSTGKPFQVFLYQTRKLLENWAAPYLVISAVILAGRTDGLAGAVLLIIFGALLVAAGEFLDQQTTTITGWIGTAIGVIMLLSNFGSELSKVWPLMLLALGLLAIVGAYLVQRKALQKPEAVVKRYAYGIGTPHKELETSVLHDTAHSADSVTPPDDLSGRLIGVFVAIFIVALFGFVVNFLGGM